MCGCASVGSKGANSTGCQGRTLTLHIIRNGLITLEKLTKDLVKKEEYKSVRGQVTELLKNTGTCPDIATVTILKDYLESEQSKYNN